MHNAGMMLKHGQKEWEIKRRAKRVVLQLFGTIIQLHALSMSLRPDFNLVEFDRNAKKMEIIH